MSNYYGHRREDLYKHEKLARMNNDRTRLNEVKARLDELERAKEGFSSQETPPAAQEPPEVTVDEKGTPDFSELTVPELKDIAREGDIEGYSSMRKAELIEAIEARIED